MSNKSLVQLTLVQFRGFYREPGVLFWAIAFPILMAWVLGLAFTQKTVQHKTVYVIPQQGAAEQPLLLNKDTLEVKSAGSDVRYIFEKATEEEAIRHIKRGEGSMFLQWRGDSLYYYFDPANPEAQLIYHQLEEVRSGNAAPPKVRVVELTNTGSRYIDFLVPGLIAMGIMNTCLWGIGWTLIEYRQKRLLRRMVATPMRKSYFLLAQLIARACISLVEGALLLLFAFIYFHIKIEGSILGMLVLYLAGVCGFSGIAVLMSCRTRKSEIGNGLINAISLPMMVLSGVFFSYHNFPAWAIPFIKVLPLTLLADTLRSIFLEGLHFSQIILPSLALLATGAVCFALGLRWYKWY